jgi:hypothetical protein
LGANDLFLNYKKIKVSKALFAIARIFHWLWWTMPKKESCRWEVMYPVHSILKTFEIAKLNN